jgi:hypothetical protein
MNKDEKLIPDLIKWRELNGQDFTINDWTSSEGNIKLAIGYSFVFWSDFIEHEECVFIKDKFSIANFNNWKNTEYVKNFAQIESVINHIHIIDFFSGEKNRNEITFDQIKYLGERICRIYAVKLKSDFPDRQFIVTFNCEEKLELDEYTLTFYQKINENRKT